MRYLYGLYNIVDRIEGAGVIVITPGQILVILQDISVNIALANERNLIGGASITPPCFIDDNLHITFLGLMGEASPQLMVAI